MGQQPKGKASHLHQIKSSKKSKTVPKKPNGNKVPNDPLLDTGTVNKLILIADEHNA